MKMIRKGTRGRRRRGENICIKNLPLRPAPWPSHTLSSSSSLPSSTPSLQKPSFNYCQWHKSLGDEVDVDWEEKVEEEEVEDDERGSRVGGFQHSNKDSMRQATKPFPTRHPHALPPTSSSWPSSNHFGHHHHTCYCKFHRSLHTSHCTTCAVHNFAALMMWSNQDLWWRKFAFAKTRYHICYLFQFLSLLNIHSDLYRTQSMDQPYSRLTKN